MANKMKLDRNDPLRKLKDEMNRIAKELSKVAKEAKGGKNREQKMQELSKLMDNAHETLIKANNILSNNPLLMTKLRDYETAQIVVQRAFGMEPVLLDVPDDFVPFQDESEMIQGDSNHRSSTQSSQRKTIWVQRARWRQKDRALLMNRRGLQNQREQRHLTSSNQRNK